MSGIIAIVGRPNVGKSALFNRIVGRRIAIVHDEPGVTRDRISAEGEWEGHPFTLVDTGGIGLLRREKSTDVIIKAAIEQVELAIKAAHVIILVVNVQEGVVPLDREVAMRLRKSGKTVLVAANKVDTYRSEAAANEFSELGFDRVFPVSAIHGEGIGNLMSAALALLPSFSPTEGEGARRADEGDAAPETAELSPSPRGPRSAKRSSQMGELTGGGLGKPLGRDEGELDGDAATADGLADKPLSAAASPSLGGPRSAERSSQMGELTGGGLGKPLGRGEGELDSDAATADGLADKPLSAAASPSPGGEGRGEGELYPKIRGPLKIAIVGRPNVGKSSIINALTQSDRVIVTPIPGTTRDAVDVPFEVETEGARQSYILIDTAGLRKSGRVDNSVEFYSVKRTEDSIARCDIAVMVLDAEAGIAVQDKKVADKIIQERKACIIVVNKWDLVEEDVRKSREEEIERRETKGRNRDERRVERLTTLGQFGQWVQEHLFFLDYAPVIFTSAKSGFNLDRLLEAVRYVAAQLQQKIPTALLNRAINDAVTRRQPVTAQGHRLKFFYATQVRQAPPTFLLFVNRDELFSDAYKKYLAGEIRRAFGYEGCPIVLVPKPRPKSVEPIRKFKPARQARQGR